MPAVRDAAYESLSQLLSGKEELDPGKKWQYRPLVDELIVGLVYDTEHTITTVNQKSQPVAGRTGRRAEDCEGEPGGEDRSAAVNRGGRHLLGRMGRFLR